MADDSPFIPPLGEVDFPAAAQDLEPQELVRQLLQVLASADVKRLDVNPGCGRRQEAPEGHWYPLIIAIVDGTSWYMRPATARAIGVLAATERRFALLFGDAAAVGRLFAKAADRAEALASGKSSFQPSKELN